MMPDGIKNVYSQILQMQLNASEDGGKHQLH